LPAIGPTIARRVACRAGTLVVALFIGWSLPPPAGAERPCSTPPPTLEGSWQQPGGTLKLRFEAERVVVLRKKGDLRAATILSRGPCQLVVRDEGLRSTWTLTGEAHSLQLDLGNSSPPFTLVPLAGTPPELDISPAALPPPGPVPPAEVRAISDELTSRSKRDQAAAVSADPELKKSRPAIVAENLRYLQGVVGRYGWIDIPRFGRPAAAAAILILKHGEDVPLMEAALPIVEHDAIANGGGKELVSILVDEVLITTGHKQKYGTQLTEDAQGKPYALPVEDPAKVDEYRKLLGILPWADYLKLASQSVYNGVPVRVPTADE
jgi:hypothetical protein